jgi:hypothetical protein
VIGVNVDAIKNDWIQLVINTPSGKESQEDDSYIRKTATRCKIPNMTTIAAALAAAKGIAARRQGKGKVKYLQEHHRAIGQRPLPSRGSMQAPDASVRLRTRQPVVECRKHP